MGGDDRSWLQGQPRVVGADLPSKTCPAYPEMEEEALSTPIYPEHQDTYLQECLDNLVEKGIQLD